WLKIEVEELREVLGVPASYRWVHFSEMLDKSILELREKAKIAVFIERIKTSRKITHLNIKFIEDNQLNMTLEGGSTPKKSRKKAA
uniref:replication initiation protein n=1 Tax=Thiofilum flexile TaxID=125627 RepID=UPI0005938E9B